MVKKNLTDVTFLIPVRIDSIVRMENLLTSIRSITRYFNTNIHVLEANKYNNHLLEKQLPRMVSYTFVYDQDPIFHRTHYINLLTRNCDSPYMVIWDADIVILPKQLWKSRELLRENICDVVFPYDGRFYDTTTILRDMFIEQGKLDILRNNTSKMLLPYGGNMGGGAIFISKDKFEYAGGEDETFYGWGPEDWNRLDKWTILGLKIGRADGPLFHLPHPRDINGGHSLMLQKHKSFFTLRNTQFSSKEDLLCQKKFK